MGVITLPANVEQDRQNGIKANSVHVQGNFDTLLAAVNKKLENDGSILPVADLPMNNHKITNMATPTASGDAATKGYVDNNACMLAGSQTITGDKDFAGTTTAITQTATDNSTKIATTAFVVDVLKAMYPVGAIFIGTQNTCPMSQFFGTWTLVATNRALWGGDGTNGNTTISAGLPNITGTFGVGPYAETPSISLRSTYTSGAFGSAGMDISAPNNVQGAGGYGTYPRGTGFDASRSSSIYGNSTTVQPPAYRVNVWRRTA